MPRKTPTRASLGASVPNITLSEPDRQQIRDALLSWYRRSHRDMPWRRSRDPYAIWVSEIMLQQTRVDTVREPFARFMARFPTIGALADAPLADVLTEWSGLGYYARARNLHAAARVIQSQHAGLFPVAPKDVRALPGIGPYTAGAILSIAFGQRAPILDGNVVRVLSRVFAIEAGPERADGKRLYWRLAEELLPSATATASSTAHGDVHNDAGDFNQALMELGAVVCTPQRPTCLVCPLATACQARRLDAIDRYPAPKVRGSIPIVQAVTVILCPQARSEPALSALQQPVLLLRRPASGLWGGLWEPPTLWLDSDELGEASETAEAGLLRLLRGRLGLRVQGTQSAQALRLPSFTHVLSHREIRFTPFTLSLSLPALEALNLDGYEAARWVDASAPLGLGLSAWVSALLLRVTQGRRAASSHLSNPPQTD